MKYKIKYTLFAIVLCFVAYVCTSCNKNNRDDVDKIYLGFNLEMTGNLAQYGQNCMDGARLAVEEINSRGGIDNKLIEICLLDNRSENADSALSMLQFEKNNISAVIGPTNSNLARSALSTGVEIPVIIPSATADNLLPEDIKVNNMFRICYTDTVQGNALAEYAIDLGIEKVVILTESSSDYSRGISEAFKEKFVELDGTVVSHEFYPNGECDFYTILSKISEEDFDAIFVPGYYTEAGLIIRQMNELGINSIILSGDAFDSPVLEEIVGVEEYLNNIFFSNHYTPDGEKSEQFMDKFYNRYNRNASAYSALGYDSVMLFAEAYLQMTNQDNEYNNLIEVLKNIKDFEGVTGDINIDENHNAQKEVKLIEITKGERKSVNIE